MSFTLNALVFNIFPTMFEMLLVGTIFVSLYSPEPTI